MSLNGSHVFRSKSYMSRSKSYISLMSGGNRLNVIGAFGVRLNIEPLWIRFDLVVMFCQLYRGGF